MSKLGEAKLGSTQFNEPAPFEVDDETKQEIRDRAEAVMKSVYPTHEGTDWDKLLNVVLREFEREHKVIADIVSGRYIDDATNAQLDKIGEFWQVERRRQEEDEHYRARIKSQLPRHTSRATIDEILQVTAILLQTDISRIHVEENFDIEPARFDVWVEDISLTDKGITIDDLEELLNDVKPAGVRVVTTAGEQFTYRSVDDWEDGKNDPDKAYGGYDHHTVPDYDPNDPTNDEPAQLTDSSELLDVGGPYADEITADFG